VIDVERRAAGFASWYELFPRSRRAGRKSRRTLILEWTPATNAARNF